MKIYINNITWTSHFILSITSNYYIILVVPFAGIALQAHIFKTDLLPQITIYIFFSFEKYCARHHWRFSYMNKNYNLFQKMKINEKIL